jgi:hypothetical protein
MHNQATSNIRKTGWKAFPFYSLLFGIYPVLALTAFNIAQIDLAATYRAFFFSLVLAGVLLIVLRLILRNWARAAFLSLLLLVLFYSYGHIYTLLKNVSLLGIVIGRHRLLGPFWAVLAGLAIWMSARKSTNLVAATPWLNILSGLLLIFPLYEMIHFELISRPGKPLSGTFSSSGTPSQSPQTYPDIYYIIPDAYMRSDNIKALYDYDNSAFLEALTQRGFYVANCSQSNYAYTELSLASSLNLNYLDQLSGTNHFMDVQLIQSNAARDFLKAYGYTTVAFETGFSWSEWKNADVYYKFKLNNYLFNEFELLFLQTSLARIPMDYISQYKVISAGAIHHDRIIYNLKLLKNLPAAEKSPKFVFAHLIIPHPSYVFGSHGEYVPDPNGLFGPETDSPLNDTTDLTGYPNSINFIDEQILVVVDQILANSKTPPIIIIQGDHGAFRYDLPAQRMSILNAYYMPGNQAQLYPTITPVNTFRVIFNSYFGQNFPLLKDASWFSPNDDRFNFTLVPNTCNR